MAEHPEEIYPYACPSCEGKAYAVALGDAECPHCGEVVSLVEEE